MAAGERFSLAKFMDELAIAGKRIPGISRTFPYPPEKVEPPALLVAWPEIVEYDRTYQADEQTDPEVLPPQAATDFVIPVFIVIGQGGTSRTRRDEVAGWLQGAVKVALEAYEYTGDPVVTVTTGVTDLVDMADGVYLATKYTVEVSTTT